MTITRGERKIGLKRSIRKIFGYEKRRKFFTNTHRAFSRHNIGDYTYGHPHVHFSNSGAHLTIGKFCSIAKNVHIFLGGNHRSDWISAYPFPYPRIAQHFPSAQGIQNYVLAKGDVQIGNDVWICQGVTILSGVTIGDGAVIAAGAVVTKNVGNYEIWGGNPAKLIKKRFTDSDIDFLVSLKWWDLSPEHIALIIPLLCSTDINMLRGNIESYVLHKNAP